MGAHEASAAAPREGRPHPVLQAYYASEAERPDFVRRLFDDTAAEYDRLNRLLAFGTGQTYRRRALYRAGLKPDASVLDVACGTGLVAAEVLRIVGPGGLVAALDHSSGMLREAGAIPALRLIRATMERLPLAESRFDMVTMGYALRHVGDLPGTLREFHRVLRPGGCLLMLEIARPEQPSLRRLARAYMRRLAPALARLSGSSAGAAQLLRYYWDTIESCIAPPAILAALREAGFNHVACATELGMFRAYTARTPAAA